MHINGQDLFLRTALSLSLELNVEGLKASSLLFLNRFKALCNATACAPPVEVPISLPAIGFEQRARSALDRTREVTEPYRKLM